MLPSGASIGNTSSKAACKPLNSLLEGATSSCKKSTKDCFCISSKSGKGSLVEILPKFVCFSIISFLPEIITGVLIARTRGKHPRCDTFV